MQEGLLCPVEPFVGDTADEIDEEVMVPAYHMPEGVEMGLEMTVELVLADLNCRGVDLLDVSRLMKMTGDLILMQNYHYSGPFDYMVDAAVMHTGNGMVV